MKESRNITTIYGISNCDTVIKALIWLREHQIEFEFHDYKKHGISLALINEFLNHFEMDSLINRRGTTWRKLPESTRNNLNLELAKSLMCSRPALIKRPIINSNASWLIGFDSDAFGSVLLGNP